MIRQAISCDICGTEMLNSNHWFVANDRGSELRISSWSARNRVKAGVRHLCGHKCLHKLVDDFMERTLKTRDLASAETNDSIKTIVDRPAGPKETSLPWVAAHKVQALPSIGSHVDEFESTAQLTRQAEQITPRGASSTHFPPRRSMEARARTSTPR